MHDLRARTPQSTAVLLCGALLILGVCGCADEAAGPGGLFAPGTAPEPAPALTVPSTEGPILLLPFDGNGEDASGNGLDAIVSSYGASFVDGCDDQALLLDGDRGFAQIPYAAELEPDRVSVEAFFRHAEPLTDGEGFVPLVVKMPESGNFWTTVDGWDLWYQDSGAGGRLGFGIGSQNGTLRVSASEFVEVPADEPVHIVGTFDGRRLTLYLNGQLVATTGYHGEIAYLQGPVWVGGQIRHTYFGSNVHAFRGTVDEVAVWGRALTAKEVRRRYDQHVAMAQGNGAKDTGYVPGAE